jgi:2-haloacid dehalogenase
MKRCFTYSTVLFDLDDTLVDFKESERLSLKACHAQFFSHLIPEDIFLRDYHHINQALWQQVEKGSIPVSLVGLARFQQLADLHQMALPPGVRLFYEQQLIRNAKLIEGAERLLDSLLARRIHIGFITNGISEVQRGKYEELGLSRYSDVLVISEDVGCSKPDARIFHHILARMQARAEDTLMVGDSLSSDGEGARGVAMPFCWYNPGRCPGPEVGQGMMGVRERQGVGLESGVGLEQEVGLDMGQGACPAGAWRPVLVLHALSELMELGG